MCSMGGCGQEAEWYTPNGPVHILLLCNRHMEIAIDLGAEPEYIDAMPKRAATK